MPKKLVRRGRVRGYRPTREQLEEILKLAQRGIGKDAIAQLRYSQGNEEIYSYGDHGKVNSGNLDEIIREAHNLDVLNNLYFSINQDSPVRKVYIQIGPGDWTMYVVESDDETWAYGRYHELTDKLLANRSLFAKGYSASPEILQKGTDYKWRPTAWELVSDWQEIICGNLMKLLWCLFSVEIIFIVYAIITYYDPGGNTPAYRNDQYNAEIILHWFNDNLSIIICLNLFYILAILTINSQIKSILRSGVILQSRSFLSQLRFQKNRNNATQLAGLYLTLIGLIVSIVALIIR